MKEAERNSTHLSSPKIDEYKEKGYIKLAGIFSVDEVTAWQRECDRLWQTASIDKNDPSIHWRNHKDKGRIADRFDPVVDRSPLFKRLVADERITDPVRSLLGTDATLLKDKLITKRPGTMGYGMHQDYPYWSSTNIPADEIFSVQLSIDPAGPENGALELFPGLHHKLLPAPADDPLDVDETRMDLSRGEIMESQPGDLLLFHSLTPHRSGPNRSSVSRRTLYLNYVPSRYKSARERYYKERPIFDIHKFSC